MARACFVEACREGVPEEVARYITGPRKEALGVDDDFKDLETGEQPEELTKGMCNVCHAGNVELLNFLLEHLDPSATYGRFKRSVLTTSLRVKETNMTQVVLDCGKDVGIDTTYEDVEITVLYLACDVGNLLAVESLCAHPNVDINQRTTLHESPLAVAVHRGHEDVVRFLLEQPGIDTDLSHVPLRRALRFTGGHVNDNGWFTYSIRWLRSFVVEEDAAIIRCVNLVNAHQGDP